MSNAIHRRHKKARNNASIPLTMLSLINGNHK
nr:MAG TPA: hypothetical protein [Caudoviricetes sp.]